MTFPIVEVPIDAPDSLEQLGSKPKFWFDGGARLFKEGRPGTGENWSEKVAYELARTLGLPAVPYDLARWGNKQGVVSDNFVPDGGRLVLANEVLVAIEPSFRKIPRYKRRYHTVPLVKRLVSMAGPVQSRTVQHPNPSLHIFVGYLLLDAWIGNTDRHEENWGFLVVGEGGTTTFRLAPTFDHASSMGREMRDERRTERLGTKDAAQTVRSYALRARSAIYVRAESSKPMTCIETFETFAKEAPGAARDWLDRLSAMDNETVSGILDRVPDDFITPTSRQFAATFLASTRERLLNPSEPN